MIPCHESQAVAAYCLPAILACHGAARRDELPLVGTPWRPCIAEVVRAPATVHDISDGALSILHGSDRALAAISQRVPGGFAGFWLTRSQQLQVGLVDTSEAANARLALLAFLPPRVPGQVSVITEQSLVTATAVKVRWSYAELYDWHVALTARGREFGVDVNSLSIHSVDAYHNRLFYGAADSISYVRLQALLRSMAVPCGLIATARVSFRLD